MERLYHYQKCAILYVDDEKRSLKYFSRAFQHKFKIFSAANTTDGYRLLEQHQDEIALVMIDQRMPGEKGVEFLRRARRLHPRAMRILTTAYSDVDVAIEAVNSGAISKYVTKPWDLPRLELILERGCEFFAVQRERDLLFKTKLSALQKMMITDRVLNSGILAVRLGHQIRNSLVGVKTFLDLLPEKLLEQEVNIEQLRRSHFWQEFYQPAELQIERINELLSDFATATKKNDASSMRELKVDSAIAESLERLKPGVAEKHITILNLIPDGLPALAANAPKLKLLLDLLLKDEINRLPDGSNIFLSGRRGSGKEQEIEIQLDDDGPRWPEESIASVFDPFSSRMSNQQEFSINLLCCYFIIYQHGGRIRVKNRPHRGVTFIVTLPVRPKTHSPNDEEETLVATTLINDVFWERMLAEEN